MTSSLGLVGQKAGSVRPGVEGFTAAKPARLMNLGLVGQKAGSVRPVVEGFIAAKTARLMRLAPRCSVA